MSRILRSTPATLTHTFYKDGTATSADGAVTVTITREDGTAFVTGAATTNTGTGVYTYSLAAQSTLDILKAVWTGTFSGSAVSETDYVEIVGGHLFSEAEARAFDNAAMASTSSYTDAAIAAERDRITDLLETWTGVSWIERYHRENVAGEGFNHLVLSKHHVNTIQGVTVDGTSKTVGDFDVDPITGFLRFTTGYFTRATNTRPRNVTVKYEHGKRTLEDGVDRIALVLLRNRLVSSNITDRTTTYSNELGTFRMAGGPSGLPEVNDWIRDHDERLPV